MSELLDGAMRHMIDRLIYEKTGDWADTSTLNAIIAFIHRCVLDGTYREVICGLGITVSRIHDEITVGVDDV